MTEENTSLEKRQEIGIQQLNVSYDKVQDRLLFRVGLTDDTEIALWFTCRFSKALWSALNGEAHLPEAKPFASEEAVEAISQFQQELEVMEALKKLDFATEYKPREAMRREHELLAVSFILSDDVKQLEVTCLEDVVVNVNLTPELILAICNMLQLAAREAGWEMVTATPATVMNLSSTSKVLH